jgi:tRNA(Ile)-lysidine synthase TilS/MesJ
MAEAPNFIWCTSGCGSGQLHAGGVEEPIVTCLHCDHRFCFEHNVPWHESLTCAEYDSLRADPENFRSRIELDNDEWETQRRAQENADRVMAQTLQALDEERRERQRIERERMEREAAQKAIAMERAILARRKREDEQTQATVRRTTKPCPGCGWAIEKNDGW